MTDVIYGFKSDLFIYFGSLCWLTGTVQIQERQRLVEKIRANELSDISKVRNHFSAFCYLL